ncbi:MAG TPA: class II aldolase/adducin family protein [Baekduia sp.]|nr:class II aldolase/adducin family protein [Baekduia sp.]
MGAFDDADRAALVAGSRTIGRSGMVPGSAGNLSLRRGERMLITPRGAELEDIDPGDLVDVALDDLSPSPDHASDSRASSESQLHRAVYQAAGARAGAVVHTHAHYATIVGTLADELPAIHYVIAAFGGPVRVARYETFGSTELASAVGEALDGRTAALMANHGAVVAGRDIRQAVSLMIQLEWVASVYYHAIAAGTPRLLGDDDLAAVRDQVKAIDYAIAGPTR